MAKKEAKTIKVTPLGDRVLIKPDSSDGKEKKSAAGIIIPVGTDEDKVDRGKVLAVGEGRVDSNGNLVPMRVKKGDHVLFQWGDKLYVEGEEYYIVSEPSILAVMK